jgi:hypothetical protein
MSKTNSSADANSRSNVLRDVLIFQVKLWLEGFKDIVLMPLSFGAAIIDLFVREEGSRDTLYSVMKLGDRFERWVALYAALEEKDLEGDGPPVPANSLDELLNEAADGLDEAAEGVKTGASDTGRADAEQASS